MPFLVLPAVILAQGPPPPPPPGGVTGQNMGVGNPPPVITTLTFQQVSGRQFKLTGAVTDNTPGPFAMTFTGAVAGTANSANDGTFSYTGPVATLGAATAVAQDSLLANSNPVSVTLTNNPPRLIGVAVTALGSNQYRFDGRVDDEAPAGLTVTFAGLPSLAGQSANVSANGFFSFSATLQSGETGTATVAVTDWYGLSVSTTVNVGS